MALYNQITYAVSSLDIAISDIVHVFSNYFLGKLPKNTFKEGSIVIDTSGLVTDVKRRDEGLINPKRMEKPYVIVNSNGGLQDIWTAEDNGPAIRQYNMFPGTTTDRRLGSNHRLGMLVDDTIGIRIDTIELRRKMELTFKFVMQSKSDLNTMKSAIYNLFSLKKASRLFGIKTRLILPNILVSDISKLAFDRTTFNINDQVSLDKLTAYLNTNGLYQFNQNVSDVNNSLNWYIFDRTFSINYFGEMVESKEADGANKINNAFDEFSFEMNFQIDFKMPNSYIMNYKQFNAPNKTMIDNIYMKEATLDKDAKLSVIYSKARFIEDRENVVPPNSRFAQLISRDEYLISTPNNAPYSNEYLQVSNYVPKGSSFWYAIEFLTPQERNGLFEMQVYENKTFIGYDSMTTENISSDVIFHINNCDTSVSFQMFLFCDMYMMKQLLPIIIKRLKNHQYVNVDANGNPIMVGSYPPSNDPSSGTAGCGAFVDLTLFGTGNFAMGKNGDVFGGNQFNGTDNGSGMLSASQTSKLKTFNVSIVGNRS